MSRWQEGTLSMAAVAALVFTGGIAARLGGGFGVLALFLAAAAAAALPLFLRQGYKTHAGFSCPLVPGLPLLGMAFNVYLLAQVRDRATVGTAICVEIGITRFPAWFLVRTVGCLPCHRSDGSISESMLGEFRRREELIHGVRFWAIVELLLTAAVLHGSLPLDDVRNGHWSGLRLHRS